MISMTRDARYAMVVSAPQGISDVIVAQEVERSGFTVAKALVAKEEGIDVPQLRQAYGATLPPDRRAVVVRATWHKPDQQIQPVIVTPSGVALPILGMQALATGVSNYAWVGPLLLTAGAVGFGSWLLAKVGRNQHGEAW